MSTNNVNAVLARITMGPSCLDMGWEWEVEEIIGLAAPVTSAAWRRMEGATRIRCSFRRPDTNTGEIGRGFGRWWWVDERASDSAILKTAWLAMMQIVDHEMYEAFKVDGVKVFDPHEDISLTAVLRSKA